MLHVAIFIILWLFNLFNGTGLGFLYHTTEILMFLCLVLTSVLVIGEINYVGKFKCNKNLIFSLVVLGFIALGSSFFRGFLKSTIDFLWIYLLIYLLNRIKLKEKNLKQICNVYGVLGVGLLYIFNYTQLLSGWNENTISMIALYSYLFFLLPNYGKKNFFRKSYVLIISVIYLVILAETDSRAAMLFSIVAFLLAIFNSKSNIVNRNNITYFMLVPLIISIVVIIVSNSSALEMLNNWSLNEFDKPIFNGRDELWKRGFEILKNNILIGSGNIMQANWHNSAVTLLASYGILGYIAWFTNLKYILKNALEKKYEYILSGSKVMFFVMYMHQSVELGYIYAKPNLLPYIMLGIILIRTKSLERFENYGE